MMAKKLIASVLSIAILVGLSGCQDNVGRVADDPNVPVGTQISKSGEFKVPDGATDPLSTVLFDPNVETGAEFSVGDSKYRKIGNGVGKLLK